MLKRGMPDKLGPTLATEVRVGDFLTAGPTGAASATVAFRQCYKVRSGRFSGMKAVRFYFRNGDRLTVAQDRLMTCWRFNDHNPSDEVAIGVTEDDDL